MVKRTTGDRALDARDTVVDEAMFTAFLIALSEDWEQEQELERGHPSDPYGPGALGWENGTIGAFLEAAAAGADVSREGLDHGHLYMPSTDVWRRCADIIYSGKVYE